MDALTNGEAVHSPAGLKLAVPVIAENGAVVPVRASSSLVGTQRLILLIDEHAIAKVAELQVTPPLEPLLSVHIRLARPCRVVALAYTTRGWFSAEARVERVHELCEH